MTKVSHSEGGEGVRIGGIRLGANLEECDSWFKIG